MMTVLTQKKFWVIIGVFVLAGFLLNTQQASSADTGYPTGNTVRDYALQKNNPVADATKTLPLREALETSISEYVSQTRWAAFHEWFGIRASTISMTEPTDTLYALSLAYPYLSTSLKAQAKEYLRTTWQNEKPYQNLDMTNPGSGSARNWHPIDNQDYLQAIKKGHPVTGRSIQLYPIYLFAQNTDSWDLVIAQYSTIKNIYNSISATMTDRDSGNNSRNIASVIGFIRIADKHGQTADVTAGLTKLESMLRQKIDHQRAEGTECAGVLDAANSGQVRNNGCLYIGSTHLGISSQWYGTVPELGKVLREYATSASNSLEKWIVRNAQGFWLVNGDTPVQEGEVHKPYYITTMSYFHIMSDIQQADFDTHLQLVDMPASRADVYYIERLVRAIEASSAQNWVNYQTPANGIVGTPVPPVTPPSPPVCPTDLNNDGTTDLGDYSEIVRDLSLATALNPKSDINKDGSVDLSDYSQLVSKLSQNCS